MTVARARSFAPKFISFASHLNVLHVPNKQFNIFAVFGVVVAFESIRHFLINHLFIVCVVKFISPIQIEFH